MTTRLAQWILGIALVLGVAGDLLLRGDPPRLGLLLWIILLVALVLVADGVHASAAGRDPRPAVRRERTWLLVALLLAAVGVVVRDAESLFAIDLMAGLILGALLVWSAVGHRLATFDLEDGPRATLRAIGVALGGAPAVLRASAAEETGDAAGGEGRRTRRREVIVGLVIAVPPLFLVASLLASADPLLGAWMADWRALFLDAGFEHLMRSAVIAWCAIGWVATVAAPAADAPAPPRLFRGGVDFARVAPTLYGLVALFAIFLGSQLRVLFGGARYLAETSGLTVAEYARDGFFDLVAVAGVVLAVLLVADRMLGEAREGDAGRFRTAGGLLLLLVAVPIVSAVARMALYVSYFGLSTDRFFAFAVMLLITVALAWFGWTMRRGARARFAPGALVIAGVWALLLNVANPEAMVVRVNAARAAAGASFDAAYHLKLSADARGPLREALVVLPFGDCLQVRQALEREHREAQAAPRPWQAWSLPRRAAAASAMLPECVPTRR